MLPNFVLVGMERTGTTLLDFLLRHHPDIYLGRRKEHFFFNLEWEMGLDNYLSHFSTYKDQKWIGDITPSYYQEDITLQRIKDTLSEDVKIIFSLRHPVHYAYSMYVHHLRHRHIDSPFFELERDQYFFPNYYKHLLTLFSTFKEENVLILFYETDIEKDPTIAMRKIEQFLEIPEQSYPTKHRSEGEGRFPRYIYSGEHTLRIDCRNRTYVIPPRIFTFCSEVPDDEPELVWKDPEADFVLACMSNQMRWTREVSPYTCQRIFDERCRYYCDSIQAVFGIPLSDWYTCTRSLYYRDACPPEQFRVT